MDKQRSRHLLRVARPNGRDDEDPALAEGFQHLREDAALAAWFEQERKVDRAIAAKMRDVRAPADLRQHILTGLEASREKRGRRPFALAIAALAAAASLALLIYTAWPQTRATLTFETIVATAVQDAQESHALSFYSAAAAEWRGWLEKEAAPVPGVLPGRLAQLETIGCRIVTWRGVRASVVAWQPAPSDGTSSTLRLFTVPQTSCTGGSASTTPVVFVQDRTTVATWRDASNYYVLVSSGSEDALRTLLAPSEGVARLAAEVAHVNGQG